MAIGHAARQAEKTVTTSGAGFGPWGWVKATDGIATSTRLLPRRYRWMRDPIVSLSALRLASAVSTQRHDWRCRQAVERRLCG